MYFFLAVTVYFKILCGVSLITITILFITTLNYHVPVINSNFSPVNTRMLYLKLDGALAHFQEMTNESSKVKEGLTLYLSTDTASSNNTASSNEKLQYKVDHGASDSLTGESVEREKASSTNSQTAHNSSSEKALHVEAINRVTAGNPHVMPLKGEDLKNASTYQDVILHERMLQRATRRPQFQSSGGADDRQDLKYKLNSLSVSKGKALSEGFHFQPSKYSQSGVKKDGLSSSKEGQSTRKDYSPICNLWYNISLGKLPDIVPRRAYYDNRIVSGERRNMVVLLTEMLDSTDVEKSLLACEMNGYHSDVAVVRETSWTNWVRTHRTGYTYCNSFIQCTGFPKQAIHEGSTVRLIYRGKSDKCYSRVETEKPLVVMSSMTPPRGSVVVCSTLFGHPPYFNEWLRYQKAIGVDKVHLNVEASFANTATETYPYLKEALSTGFVSVEVWRNYLGERTYYHAQMLKYQDCVMRYTGVYEYAFICDPDDFFNPMIPGIKDIHYYFQIPFTNKHVSSVRFHWKRYECKPVKYVYESFPDGNITKGFSEDTSATWTSNYKTVHRLSTTDIVSVHAAASVLPLYKYSIADGGFAYVAHIRPGQPHDPC